MAVVVVMVVVVVVMVMGKTREVRGKGGESKARYVWQRGEVKRHDFERQGQLTAGENKDRIRKLHDREVAQVLEVDGMARDAEQRERNWKAVDHDEEPLEHDDAVDEARQELLRDDRVLLHQLGEVVQARRW